MRQEPICSFRSGTMLLDTQWWTIFNTGSASCHSFNWFNISSSSSFSVNSSCSPWPGTRAAKLLELRIDWGAPGAAPPRRQELSTRVDLTAETEVGDRPGGTGVGRGKTGCKSTFAVKVGGGAAAPPPDASVRSAERGFAGHPRPIGWVASIVDGRGKNAFFAFTVHFEAANLNKIGV